MAQVIAGFLYLFMAALLVVFYERHVAVFIPSRRWRIFLRALALLLLFTPGLISAGGEIYPVPASIAVLYNLLSHSWIGTLKAMLPLLLSGALVFAVLAALELRRRERGEGGA